MEQCDNCGTKSWNTFDMDEMGVFCEECYEDYQPYKVPCCKCKEMTTVDDGDLCYRCCRADNE